MIRRTALAALAAAFLFPAPASAFTLGVGDRGDAPAAPSKKLGARVYRVVIDPSLPLSTYDERIWEHRQAGQEPQLAIGGTGTRYHASTRGVVETAVRAAKRWPYAYSISVINEPDLSGVGVCGYGRTWLRAYRALRPLGVRLLFGEWAGKGLHWQRALMDRHRCHNTAPQLRRRVKHVAWHAYGDAIDWAPKLREATPRSDARLYATEAGAVLKIGTPLVGNAVDADVTGIRYWRKAVRMAREQRLVEMVAWDVHSPPAHSRWDSSLIDANGRPRPAFHVIRSAARR